jgi:serine/threonine-protein kinase
VKFCPRDGQTLKSANPSGDLIGQVIADRYHVTKKLGEGGMGAVYLAEHVKMGRKSAIKVMSASMSQDADAVSRFNREANNASRIQHPNICAIYDFGETPDGLMYLAMEFIEGNSLNEILKKSGPMSLQRATSILKQTAEALHVAHEGGIVHRDLKPDNIMIAQQGGKDLVKVVDFGIAKAVGGDESGQKVTKTGLVVGTPEYMSPEQLSGDKLDGRSDLYSLALVYYRMITGTLPFQAETSQETMIKRLTDEPMPLRQAYPTGNFPPALQQAMDRALARYAAERYSDAVEFANDVQAAIAGIAPEGGATMVVGASDLKTMVAGAAPSTSAMPKTRISRPGEKEGRAPSPDLPKSKNGLIAAGVIGVLVLGGGGYAMFGRGAATPPAARPDSAAVKHDSVPAGTTTTPAGGTTTPTGTPSNPQTMNRPVPNPTTPQHPANPGTNTPAALSMDPMDVRTDLGRMLDASDNADKASLDGFIAKSEKYYRNHALPDALRAQAAAYDAQFYLLEAKMAQAAGNAGDEGRLRSTGKDWARNAADMDSKWQSLLALFD